MKVFKIIIFLLAISIALKALYFIEFEYGLTKSSKNWYINSIGANLLRPLSESQFITSDDRAYINRYTNDELGFEFTYPNSIIYKDGAQIPVTHQINNDFNPNQTIFLQKAFESSFLIEPNPYRYHDIYINITAYSNPDNLEIPEYYEELVNRMNMDTPTIPIIYTLTKIRFKNNQAYLANWYYDGFISSYNILMQKDNYIYLISFGERSQLTIEEVETIFKSFNFVESNISACTNYSSSEIVGLWLHRSWEGQGTAPYILFAENGTFVSNAWGGNGEDITGSWEYENNILSLDFKDDNTYWNSFSAQESVNYLGKSLLSYDDTTNTIGLEIRYGDNAQSFDGECLSEKYYINILGYTVANNNCMKSFLPGVLRFHAV